MTAFYNEIDPFAAQWSRWPLVEKTWSRAGRIRGYGNAIVPQAAAIFVRAAVEAIGLLEAERG